jgi:serine/threonine protein kinase
MRLRLLNCLAGAVLKHGGKFLFHLVPGGDAIYEIAVEAWSAYRRDHELDSARLEVEALAQASAEQVREAIAVAVQDVAAQQSAQVQEALTAYLHQVPSAIRRSLRRPSDPSGKSVPANVGIRGAEDLVQFLPARMPRFKAGDRPLPGVDWELEELAGVGGFGEVWKARHPYLKSKPPVALKFCLDSSATAALRNEAGVLDRVMQHGRHAGIVPLLHTYLSADPPCLEYEYVEGGDLTGLIQEMHARGPVKPEVANRLLVRLAEIVAFAHKAEPPIVHGDLKPANVLVRRMPDGKIALRVIDFGIGGLSAARAVQEARTPTRSRPALLTEAVRGAHTPVYASPEQMARRPGEQADPRDDVHALGVIWYQLITGDLGMLSIPSDWREQLVEHGVGEELIRLLGSCIAPKADKRPANAAVLVEQVNYANAPMLELVEDGAVGPARAATPRAAPSKTARPEMPRGVPPAVKLATARRQQSDRSQRDAEAMLEVLPVESERRPRQSGSGRERGRQGWLLVLGLVLALGVAGCIALILWKPWSHDSGAVAGGGFSPMSSATGIAPIPAPTKPPEIPPPPASGSPKAPATSGAPNPTSTRPATRPGR